MIYDLTQSVFSCEVYPGDPAPQKREVLRMERGDICNLTAFSMCAHNGTHVDAPFHFFKDGKGIDKVALEKFVGPAYVFEHSGDLTAEAAEKVLKKAAEAKAGAEKRLLMKGKATVTEEAARIFAAAGMDLIGNESQTVGPEKAPMAVHLILLEKEIVLLEGIRLAEVPEGVYFLSCAPLKLEDADGAPCRAILCDF